MGHDRHFYKWDMTRYPGFTNYVSLFSTRSTTPLLVLGPLAIVEQTPAQLRVEGVCVEPRPDARDLRRALVRRRPGLALDEPHVAARVRELKPYARRNPKRAAAAQDAIEGRRSRGRRVVVRPDAGLVISCPSCRPIG